MAAMPPNPAITRAMQSVAEAIPRAEADPARPVYHFHPPAQWMNDPNGTLFHNGYYHVFYQHNPYGDAWGHMHWGHTKSKDLVHWEQLPIALWPSEELGEGHCFSGCAHINGEGRPIAIYTKVPPKPEVGSQQQWAALGDPDLITWEKHPKNPILDLETQGGPKFGGSWRDPFVFEEAGRTFLILGADLGEEAVIPIYEAKDKTLASWQYKGIFFRLPKTDVQFFECPNFARLGDKWILYCSPYRPVEYFVGAFDLATLTFKPSLRGRVDQSDQYYATNLAWDDKGRCVQFGWVRGFKDGMGWNGCLALPRILSLGPDGRPVQQPAPELESLRGKHVSFSGISLTSEGRVLDQIKGDILEILATFLPGDAKVYGLKVRRSEDGANAITIRREGTVLDVAGVKVALSTKETEAPLNLHVFLDKSVMEVFVDGGRACVTRVHYPGEEDLGVELFAEEGKATVKSIDVYEMRPIDEKEIPSN
jgi:beta-fructofuranosidase